MDAPTPGVESTLTGLAPCVMRTISTGMLTLEPQTLAHADAMFAVLSDPAIYEFENAPPASLAWLQERFAKLETRQSPDGREHWLNWVIRLPSAELAGYVQATVRPGGEALIAYELASRHWGRGLARAAVLAMIGELVACYGVRRLTAILKRSNHRSLRLLERLGFTPGHDGAFDSALETDELSMHRPAFEADVPSPLVPGVA